jgi:hypothetical protein
MGVPAQAMGSLCHVTHLTPVEEPNEVNVTPVTYRALTGALVAGLRRSLESRSSSNN